MRSTASNGKRCYASTRAFGLGARSGRVARLSPDNHSFVEDETYTVFPSSEVEGAPLAEGIIGTVEAVEPDRVFVDPMTQ